MSYPYHSPVPSSSTIPWQSAEQHVNNDGDIDMTPAAAAGGERGPSMGRHCITSSSSSSSSSSSFAAPPLIVHSSQLSNPILTLRTHQMRLHHSQPYQQQQNELNSPAAANATATASAFTFPCQPPQPPHPPSVIRLSAIQEEKKQPHTQPQVLQLRSDSPSSSHLIGLHLLPTPAAAAFLSPIQQQTGTGIDMTAATIPTTPVEVNLPSPASGAGSSAPYTWQSRAVTSGSAMLGSKRVDTDQISRARPFDDLPMHECIHAMRFIIQYKERSTFLNEAQISELLRTRRLAIRWDQFSRELSCVISDLRDQFKYNLPKLIKLLQLAIVQICIEENIHFHLSSPSLPFHSPLEVYFTHFRPILPISTIADWIDTHHDIVLCHNLDDSLNTVMAVRGVIVIINPIESRQRYAIGYCGNYACAVFRNEGHEECVFKETEKGCHVPNGQCCQTIFIDLAADSTAQPKCPSCHHILDLEMNKNVLMAHKVYESYQQVTIHDRVELKYGVNGPKPTPHCIALHLWSKDARRENRIGDEIEVIGMLCAITNEKTNLVQIELVAHSTRRIEGYSIDEVSLKKRQSMHRQIASQNPAMQLVNSLCPRVYGHEIVKLGLVLAMLSCSNEDVNSTDSRTGFHADFPGRTAIHVLLVDQSEHVDHARQLLHAVYLVSPRSAYQTIRQLKSTNGAKDAHPNAPPMRIKPPSNTIELSHMNSVATNMRGVHCIYVGPDWMHTLHNQGILLSLLETQQLIHNATARPAEAGYTAQYKSQLRTSFILAGQPQVKKGTYQYDPQKLLHENIGVTSSCLEAIDLAFSIDAIPASPTTVPASPSQSIQGRAATLKNHITVTDAYEAIPTEVMSNYISYALSYPDPIIDVKEMRLIDACVVEWKLHQSITSASVQSLKVNQTLVRLAKAWARMELRSKVTSRDIQFCWELLRYSLHDLVQEDQPCKDMRTSGRGSASSKMGMKKQFVAEMLKYSEEKCCDSHSLSVCWSIAERMRPHPPCQIDRMKEFLFELIDKDQMCLKGQNGTFKFVKL